MAHKFYCTHCARELNQDLVYLDMEPALTVSAKDKNNEDDKTEVQKFQLLKFRLTVAEYNALFADIVPGDLGYKHLDLSIEQFAGYVANERNLNDSAIAALTLADIDGYLKDKQKNDFGEADEADQAVDLSDGIDDFSMDNLFEDTQKKEAPQEEAYTPSEAILALKGKIATAKGENLTERMLEEDLSMLRKLVGDNGCIHIAVKDITNKADTNDDILVGYYARRGDKKISVDTARICCHCGTKVFEHAGEAEHRAVAFIGEQSSAKTSTILALTHYADRAARTVNLADKIWQSSSSIPGIEIMEVVGRDDDLEEDLNLYNIGVAPKKTEAQEREDAYSSTLWITNSRDQKFILTLIDLPGELCKKDGTIDKDNILNNFPVAMASDVFVMCFDTTRSVGQDAARTITNTCSWARHFQELRRDYKQTSVIRQPGDTTPELTRECVAPMMLVFTKCEGLEEGVREQQQALDHVTARRVAEIYSLKAEREFIDRNPIYKDVGERVQVYDTLKYGYLSRLRTSPYGFAAPNKLVYMEDHSVNKDENGDIIYPRPKQVDKLMQWLMVVTGCVPAPAEYFPNPSAEPNRVYRLENVCVRGAQYRVWLPQGATFKDRVNEAMYRAYLFENYSDDDQAYIQNYDDSSWEREWLKWRENNQNGNGGNGGNGGTKGIDDLIERFKKLLGIGKEKT